MERSSDPTLHRIQGAVDAALQGAGLDDTGRKAARRDDAGAGPEAHGGAGGEVGCSGAAGPDGDRDRDNGS